MSKFTKVFENSYNELMHKVTWPSWPALQQSTIVVLIGFLVITIILFGMDIVSETIFETFYGFFK
jgi:preprotein translocase subunit SecE